jgi:SAM-dependent methyltransferase
MMVDLDPERVSDYFSRPGTIEEWWYPDTGELAFHYDAEVLVLDRHIGADSAWRVLDVGTGRGRFGAHFARRGCRVIGVDANEGMLEAARENAVRGGVEANFELRRGLAEDLSQFEDESFDAVLCMELFDHLPSLARALTEMQRVLKPGGRFAFTYVPSESLYGAIGNVYRWIQTRRGKRGELISRTYSLGSIRRQLEEAGLPLDSYYGVGLLCVSAQTRLFTDNPLHRLLTAIARAEARVRPYHSGRVLARHAAHVVGLAHKRAGAV